eukprot:m.435667 g.435667  ORF g.435667 m.435667 type:complete len:323 (-) comp20261_c1_seq3:1538-2506(-)
MLQRCSNIVGGPPCGLGESVRVHPAETQFVGHLLGHPPTLLQAALASLESFVARQKGNRLAGFMSLTREIATAFVVNHWPTQEPLPGGDVAESPMAVKARNVFLRRIAALELPNSPLDELVDSLGGHRAVAEMTGRSHRIIDDGHGKVVQSRSSEIAGLEALNVRERDSFMQGDKLVAIISDAASTGISLHAGLRVNNQRRRLHITVELPWSAEKAVQQLGRTHRTSQVGTKKRITGHLGRLGHPMTLCDVVHPCWLSGTLLSGALAWRVGSAPYCKSAQRLPSSSSLCVLSHCFTLCLCFLASGCEAIGATVPACDDRAGG